VLSGDDSCYALKKLKEEDAEFKDNANWYYYQIPEDKYHLYLNELKINCIRLDVSFSYVKVEQDETRLTTL